MSDPRIVAALDAIAADTASTLSRPPYEEYVALLVAVLREVARLCDEAEAPMYPHQFDYATIRSQQIRRALAPLAELGCPVDHRKLAPSACPRCGYDPLAQAALADPP